MPPRSAPSGGDKIPSGELEEEESCCLRGFWTPPGGTTQVMGWTQLENPGGGGGGPVPERVFSDIGSDVVSNQSLNRSFLLMLKREQQRKQGN